MRKLGALVLALGLLGGCGDSGPSEEEQQAQAQEAAEQAAQGCEEVVGGFLESLQELDSTLDIGLSFDEYGDEIAALNVQYDRLDPDDVSEECLEDVAVPAEDAFTKYYQAYTRWDKCMDTYTCELDDIESNLQDRWLDAAIETEDALDALDEMATPSPSPTED